MPRVGRSIVESVATSAPVPAARSSVPSRTVTARSPTGRSSPKTGESSSAATRRPRRRTERNRHGRSSRVRSRRTTAGTDRYDVSIVGDGPAGRAATPSCVRLGLETVVVADGHPTLQKCACVESYPSFPAGIEPRVPLTPAREHVERSPCTVEDGTVEPVARRTGSVRLDLDGEGSMPTTSSWPRGSIATSPRARHRIQTRAERSGPGDRHGPDRPN